MRASGEVSVETFASTSQADGEWKNKKTYIDSSSGADGIPAKMVLSWNESFPPNIFYSRFSVSQQITHRDNKYCTCVGRVLRKVFLSVRGIEKD